MGVFGVWFGTEVSDHGDGVGSGGVRVRRWVCSIIGVEKWSWQRVLAWKWVSALGVFRCIECSVGVQMGGVVGSSRLASRRAAVGVRKKMIVGFGCAAGLGSALGMGGAAGSVS